MKRHLTQCVQKLLPESNAWTSLPFARSSAECFSHPSVVATTYTIRSRIPWNPPLPGEASPNVDTAGHDNLAEWLYHAVVPTRIIAVGSSPGSTSSRVVHYMNM